MIIAIVMTPPEQKQDWVAVQIPREILDECEIFANSPLGKKLGFTRKAQVVNSACREFLDKYSKEYYFDIDSKKLNITLSFKVKAGQITCELCNSHNCEHVDEILTNKKIRSILSKRGVEVLMKSNT